MTILNMVGGGTSGPKVPLNAISVIAAVGGDTEATITWTDPSDIVVNGVTVTTWSSTKLVRKAGSVPTDSTDGTLVVTETVRDTYSSTGYTDTGLTNGTTYYYAAFAVGDNGLETISSTTPDVTPQPAILFSLSTDLRNYTTEAQLQALGWGGIHPYNSASYTLNSNGLSLTNGGNKQISLRCAMPLQLTTSNIITLEATGYAASQRGNQRCSITSSEGDDDANNIGGYLSLYSSDNETGIRVDGAWKGGQLGQGYGDYTQKIVINLGTGVITYTGTTSQGIGTINKTYTMTSSEISSALSKTYIAFEQAKFTGSNTQRIYTASIKIE